MSTSILGTWNVWWCDIYLLMRLSRKHQQHSSISKYAIHTCILDWKYIDMEKQLLRYLYTYIVPLWEATYRFRKTLLKMCFHFPKVGGICYPPWNQQPPIIDGWKANFLLGCHLFSCELLVSGRVVPPTWRIIPFSKWLITMVSKSPGVIPLPNGLFMAYKCGWS